MYYGEFDSKQSVASNFGIDYNELKNCVILFAAYDLDGYEGSAEVIFIKQGRIYTVQSSHCSCNGLEWSPEETSVEALKHIANEGCGLLNGYKKQIIEGLKELEELGLFELDADQAQTLLALKY